MVSCADQTFVDYAGDPAGAIEGYLATAYNYGGGGTNSWSGTIGIVSSTVSALNEIPHSLVYAIGYADGNDRSGSVTDLSSGQIEIMPTLAADATLSGKVTFADFQILSEYYSLSGSWDEGNFSYASFVDFGDFELLAENIGHDDSALF